MDWSYDTQESSRMTCDIRVYGHSYMEAAENLGEQMDQLWGVEVGQWYITAGHATPLGYDLDGTPTNWGWEFVVQWTPKLVLVSNPEDDAA